MSFINAWKNDKIFCDMSIFYQYDLYLTPITTAADDNHKYFFIVIQRK